MIQKSDVELAFEQKMFYVTDILDRLSSTRRYATHEILKDINVAEHSYRVAMIALVLAKCVDGIDELKLLKRALLHDFEEGISGDILYPVKNKNASAKKFFKKIEEETISEMFKEFPVDERDEWQNHIRLAKEGDEGKIVAIADMIEILVFLAREIRLGNNQYRFFQKVMAYVYELIHDDKRFDVLNIWLNTLYNNVLVVKRGGLL